MEYWIRGSIVTVIGILIVIPIAFIAIEINSEANRRVIEGVWGKKRKRGKR